MQGRKVLSFLETKNNPVPTGDVEGHIIPESKELSIYSTSSWPLSLALKYCIID